MNIQAWWTANGNTPACGAGIGGPTPLHLPSCFWGVDSVQWPQCDPCAVRSLDSPGL